jgi:hypothetical protein
MKDKLKEKLKEKLKTAPGYIVPILSNKKKKLRKQVNPFEYQRLALTPINNGSTSTIEYIYDHDVPDNEIFDNGALDLLKF